MELEITADGCLPPPLPSWPQRLLTASLALWRRALWSTALLGGLLLAVRIAADPPYTSGSRFGYNLGVIGGSLMLALLVYPVRKRLPQIKWLGPLRHWFRFHLVAGIAGPLLVTFHSTFRVGSFNAAIAFASMLLVAASGLVGRFLYRKIHHGLFGSRANIGELQAAVDAQLATMEALLAEVPSIHGEIHRFKTLLAAAPATFGQRTLHFALAGRARRRIRQRIRKVLAGDFHHRHAELSSVELAALLNNINDALKAMQRCAQFATYERLFSLWHVVHIPFLFLLVITAIVHVVAVHAY